MPVRCLVKLDIEKALLWLRLRVVGGLRGRVKHLCYDIDVSSVLANFAHVAKRGLSKLARLATILNQHQRHLEAALVHD